LFVALAGAAALFVLIGILLTGLTTTLLATLLALLAALALLLTALLARPLLVLVFLLLTFLARLFVLVHWTSKEGVIPAFGFNPLPCPMVPVEPHGSKGFFVYFLTVAQSRGVAGFATATLRQTVN
jgi:hypothetical protein